MNTSNRTLLTLLFAFASFTGSTVEAAANGKLYSLLISVERPDPRGDEETLKDVDLSNALPEMVEAIKHFSWFVKLTPEQPIILSKETSGQTIKLLNGKTLKLEPVRNVIQAVLLDFMARADANDTIIFYFTGHGYLDKSPYPIMRLGPSDDPFPRELWLREDVLSRLWYSYDELDNTRNPKILIFIDVCRTFKDKGEHDENRALDSEIFAKAEDRKTLIFYSSVPGQSSKASIDVGMKMGFFTKYLIDALRGAADTNGSTRRTDRVSDGKLYVYELVEYINAKLEAELGKGIQVVTSHTPELRNSKKDGDKYLIYDILSGTNIRPSSMEFVMLPTEVCDDAPQDIEMVEAFNRQIKTEFAEHIRKHFLVNSIERLLVRGTNPKPEVISRINEMWMELMIKDPARFGIIGCPDKLTGAFNKKGMEVTEKTILEEFVKQQKQDPNLRYASILRPRLTNQPQFLSLQPKNSIPKSQSSLQVNWLFFDLGTKTWHYVKEEPLSLSTMPEGSARKSLKFFSESIENFSRDLSPRPYIVPWCMRIKSSGSGKSFPATGKWQKFPIGLVDELTYVPGQWETVPIEDPIITKSCSTFAESQTLKWEDQPCPGQMDQVIKRPGSILLNAELNSPQKSAKARHWDGDLVPYLNAVVSETVHWDWDSFPQDSSVFRELSGKLVRDLYDNWPKILADKKIDFKGRSICKNTMFPQNDLTVNP